ncbi:MAG TPA: ATP-binding protein [Thermoanaerobaculia bacterium]|nr:ATP-binding protein [Thermoanaerobaculia bacterium]
MLSSPATSCPRCAGTGWIVEPSSFDSRPCGCQGELKKRRRIENARIPKRYFDHCTLAGFNERSNGSLLHAKRTAREFVDEWPTPRSGLLLMGGCGTGKTHLAVAILREIIEIDKPGKLLFINFQDLIQEIQASFDSDQSARKSEILRPVLGADLLVLDELGSQKPTNFVQDTLYSIINSRYNDQGLTIFTTNYLDESQRSEETLETRIGKRLRSRLHEMCRTVMIEADDYRKSYSRRI